MEKIMFFMAAIVACSSAAAEYEYMPLVQEGKVWEYQARDNGNQSDNVCMMEFRGDTLINDTTFKKLYFYDTKTLTSPQWPLAYMCEIDKKVYARINDAMCEALQKGPYNVYSIMGTIVKPYCYMTSTTWQNSSLQECRHLSPLL